MALGLGVDPLGEPLLGLDAIHVPERHGLKPIAAKRFDPKTRAYVVNIDGQYVEDHPIDQWVVLQLAIIRGSIPASPAEGNPALRYEHIGADHVAKVKRDIEQLLSPRAVAGDITVHLVEVAAPGNATLMQVDYTNNVTVKRGIARA